MKKHNRGGPREGAGRPKGATGKELKKVYSLRAYPSDVSKLEIKLQKLLDKAIRQHLENTG
jgi:hypothetical protein